MRGFERMRVINPVAYYGIIIAIPAAILLVLVLSLLQGRHPVVQYQATQQIQALAANPQMRQYDTVIIQKGDVIADTRQFRRIGEGTGVLYRICWTIGGNTIFVPDDLFGLGKPLQATKAQP